MIDVTNVRSGVILPLQASQVSRNAPAAPWARKAKRPAEPPSMTGVRAASAVRAIRIRRDKWPVNPHLAPPERLRWLTNRRTLRKRHSATPAHSENITAHLAKASAQLAPMGVTTTKKVPRHFSTARSAPLALGCRSAQLARSAQLQILVGMPRRHARGCAHLASTVKLV